MSELDAPLPHQRATDRGMWATIALRCSQAWDWIDKRDIDKHVAAFGILIFMLDRTVRITVWARQIALDWIAACQAAHCTPGSDVALVIGSVTAPWAIALPAVIGPTLAFYFRART